MKKSRKPNDVDGLLNVVLADADWQALNCSLKRDALAVIGATRQRRRVQRRIGQVASAVMLLVAAGWWLLPSTPHRGLAVASSTQTTLPVGGDTFISEEQMLAMFPAGSCVVAEVNGHKELVFLDAKMAQNGFILSSR